jgi:hypothetical protein
LRGVPGHIINISRLLKRAGRAAVGDCGQTK